ncbi:MAG: histidinol-phosphate transaminase [Deltaproteobacteria bacterium]|nr:histidinol-phosphate transaminase [Deltaproteobacteria bacterium]MBN2673966.1 histidinol-phosphate transaminase [Deltaproteobacteria bacterium]
MSRFWSEVTKSLEPYVPGEQPQLANIIKLNTNENPYGPSPKVIQAISEQTTADLRKYPEPDSDALKQAVAGYWRIAPKQVFVGNGSDEVLAHVFMAFFKGEAPILFPDVTYSFYPVYCGLYQIPFEQIPLTDQFRIDVATYQRKNGGIIFANPNAPTGVALKRTDIEELLRQNTDSVVVIDEAYVDFGAESCVPLINSYPNLLVVQTVSKSRCLAGLRVGFACGSEELIEGLERVKNSFNSYPVDRLASAGAIAAFEDTKYFEETTEQIIYNRKMLTDGLKKLGFTVLPSKANFVFTSHPKGAERIKDELREQSIVVRHFQGARTSDFLRITVGAYREMKTLLAALEQIVK